MWFDSASVGRAGRLPGRLPVAMKVMAALAVLLLLAVAVELWRLRAGAFLLFLIPMLLASMGISTAMAVYWRERRALPLALVFALLAARGGLEVAMRSGAMARTEALDLVCELLLWASIPAAFGAIAALWRIFENQARFQQGQRDLLAHEARYRYLIENANDAFYTADAAGRLTLVNAAAARLFGRRAGDLEDLSFYDLVGESTSQTVRDALQMMGRKDIRAFYHEFSIARRDGTERWVGQNLQAQMDGREVIGFQAVLRDITDRRLAEESLRQSEARLRTLFETLSEGVLQTRADGRIVFSNPAAERILGLPTREIESRHCADPAWDFIRPDGSPMPIEEWVGFRAHKEKRSTAHAVTGVRRGDGSVVWLSAGAEPIMDSAGQMGGVVLTFADISKSKSTEENLQIIEFALDSALEHVFLATREGRLLYANKSALKALGYAVDELAGMTLFDVAPDVTPDDWAETWRRASAGEWPTFESHFRAKSGRTYPVTTSASHVEFNGREYLFAFTHDISREAELATQLRHAQKMEAIGILAGGIAHDFNNILGGVLGYADLTLQDTPESSPVRPFLQEIVAGSHRAADLVRQILTFSRRTEQKQMPFRMAPVVKEALKLLRGTLPATVEFSDRIDAECGPIMGDPGQIHQVMMNLCTNAWHAMRETGGRLTVELREVDVGAEWTSAEFILDPGRYVQLSVTDTGCGMDAETQRRIFEPFFTTKKQGEGTGLGLATVHGIAKSHKGGIRVASAPGKGTRFDVLFPLCQQKADSAEAGAEDGTRPAGTETVLFVDDEPAIVVSVGEGLRRLGYTVETAANGVDALALFEAAPRRFDLVITDQTMPQMTGFELARRLLRLKPDTRIILCTGLSETVGRDDARGVGIQELVPKPFEMRELAQTVRRVLDQSEPA